MSPWMKFAEGGDGQVPAVITRSPSPVTPAAEVEIVVDAGATDETRGHRVFIDGKLSYFDPSPRGSWSLGPSDALELLDGVNGQFESVGEDAHLVLKFADGIRGRLVLDVPTRRNERGVHGEDVEALVHDDTGAAEILHEASPSVGAPDGAGSGTSNPTVGETPSAGGSSAPPADGHQQSGGSGNTAERLEDLVSHAESYEEVCEILGEFVIIPRSGLPEVTESGGTFLLGGIRYGRSATASKRYEQAVNLLALAKHLEAKETERNTRRDELARELGAGTAADIRGREDLSEVSLAAIDRIIDFEQAQA